MVSEDMSLRAQTSLSLSLDRNLVSRKNMIETPEPVQYIGETQSYRR